jgi:oligopeptide/dipeptide ABC transporter ATP-binding protein
MSDIIEIKDLKKYFTVSGGRQLKAIDGISFSIKKGETFGLVGESGCGKTTTGRVLVRLYDPTGGKAIVDGVDIFSLEGAESKAFTRKVQMIFQDPYASLNPRRTVQDSIAEGMDIHGLYQGEERLPRIYELLELVGLSKEHAGRFPHEFSGGQRQRIGIARALACDPEIIVCDEPISALDVSIQAQIVNLLMNLQKELGLTLLFIAHDLSMVKYISDRVGVMYLGSLAEIADANVLYDEPLHPYTISLLSAIPIPDPEVERSRQRIVLKGEVPSPINSPSGCKFFPRCPRAIDKCKLERPELIEVKPNHYCACHLVPKQF